MDEEETKTEVSEPVSNWTSRPEKSDDVVAGETEKGSNVVKEMEEDKKDDENVETEKIKEKKKKAVERKEPEKLTPLKDRPVRERKSVKRLVESVEVDKDAPRKFQIEKGCGIALKDIPNVAFKLSRRKPDDTFRLLHTILFGRRGKDVQIKRNISRFSGFVWHENEEKQKTKIKEKFDKCNKEKLMEFCDVLDMPIRNVNTRKEDIVAKLIDFLEAPRATTTVLLAEKDKSSKSKKRKKVTKWGTTSKRSAKSRRKSVDTRKSGENSTPDSKDESDEEEEGNEEEENENGVTEKSEDEMPEDSDSEEKNESEDVGKKKKSAKVSSRKNESAGKDKSKKVTALKLSTTPKKRAPNTSTSKSSKADEYSDKSPKVSSRKKTVKVTKEKSSTPTKCASKEKTSKMVAKGKDKAKKEKFNPSDYELKTTICEILKEVDFNTATFTDILKLLAQRFDTDLNPRKSSIKLMMEKELTRLVDDEDGEEDAEKDGTQSADQEAEA